MKAHTSSRARAIADISTLTMATAAIVTAIFGTTAAHAQKQNSAKLVAPSVSITRVRPDVAELSVPVSISTAGTKLEYQVTSGPNAAGSLSSITLNNLIQVGLRNVQGSYPIQLLPDSNYTVRVRRVKTSADVSPWTSVNFRTPAQFDSRPSAPPNLRISQQTTTQVTLSWDAPAGVPALNYPSTYELFLNNQRTYFFQCGGVYVQCTEADFRTVTISRPAPGTTLTFGVTARDSNLNRSEASTLTIN